MTRCFPSVFAAAAALSFLLTPLSQAKDRVSIVGSSTVYPFAATVIEAVRRTSPFKAPTVESTGSGGGFKMFCGKEGVNSPDIVNSSRRAKLSELRRCRENNISMVEFIFGRDGIVIASSKQAPPLALSNELIFTALAEDNGFDKRPGTWAEAASLVRHKTLLPDIPIQVYGPPPTSGTRDAFLELIMEPGAKKLSQQFGWSKKEAKQKAHKIREDGAWISAGENDNLNIQRIVQDPQSQAIFGFSFLDSNMDKIQGAAVNGVRPSFENIASGDYSAARALFFYVKKNRLGYVPGLEEYVKEFISQKAIGEEGYLTDKGLIPLTEEEFEAQFEKLKSWPVFDLPES